MRGFSTRLIVVLLVAIFLMQKALKDHFNAGWMGDKRPAPTAT